MSSLCVDIKVAAYVFVQNSLEQSMQELQADYDFVLAAVRSNCTAYCRAAEEFQTDRRIVYEVIKEVCFSIETRCANIKMDKRTVLDGINRLSYAVAQTNKNFTVDQHLLCHHLSTWPLEGWALSLFPEDPIDSQICVAILEKFQSALNFDNVDLYTDRNKLMQKVKTHGWALKYATDALKKDRELVLTAVKRNDFAIKYADEELHGDREIVLAAVKGDGTTFQYASKQLQADAFFCCQVGKHNRDGKFFKYVNEKLKKDPATVLELLEHNKLVIHYVSNKLLSNQNFVLATLKLSGGNTFLNIGPKR